MAKYTFSGGKIRVEPGINLSTAKSQHPLASTLLILVNQPDGPVVEQSTSVKTGEKVNGHT